MQSKFKIVVFLNHGLGDVLMGISFLRKLSSLFPESQIDLIVKSELEIQVINAFKINPNFNLISFKSIGLKKLALKLLFTKYKYYFAPHIVDSFKYLLVNLIVNAECSYGPIGKFDFLYSNKIGNKERKHKTDYYLNFLPNTNQIEANNKYIFDIEPYNSLVNCKYVVIAPGSGEVEKHKRIPSELLSKFIVELNNKYQFDVVLLGTKSEDALLKSISSESKFVKIIHVSKFEESLSIIKYAEACVTPCNGTSHIAAALETPLLSVYGPTNPAYTGAYSKKLVTLRLNMLCSPCYRKEFIAGCGDNKCMTSIGLPQLTESFDKLISGDYDKEMKWFETKTLDTPTF